ncbi:tripartite tricarboxylate transporter substrate binding protein [Pigmentiphaga sp. GD03639]|uniref:Tripartite-type tricarboxylate transporter receptor subunit TctC n=1 Tax=Pigmentiphaga kullae TaxID=151784 RepID=A0A4V2F3H4_9BURK|nr:MULTISPECIES: tripartite tricarboxylate transporter substrate binding protein [Pigmentiphaga]MDH2238480.1 tripartite tricarboxylate transporter substrate binding protein [Pigmentiphaga sp. GD03639]RZS84117.1 tripartite-type tricarboxylate transporter receptor subunit TctC [Pigmentiphaga kullae]
MKPYASPRACATLAALILALQGAAAQADGPWPNKPVRVIMPFAAGGSSDLVGRQVAQSLSAHYGQQFVAENRAGAGGNIGVDAVAKSAPDGYTLGIGTSGPLANNKSLYHPMPFDAEKDLTPIALVGEIPVVIAVNPAVKANTLAEFVALSKSSANAVTVSNPGNGTIGHLATEYLSIHTGAKLQPVPYKGDSPAMVDAMSGSVSAVVAPVTSLIPNIQANKLRALAVMSKTRFPGLPDVPTANEQGVKLEATVWSAMVGPAGLPKSVVSSLNAEINKYTASPEGKAKLNSLGMVPLSGTPEQLRELMRNEATKWQEVVKSARISIE